ncbi:hypothetical protein P8452_13723 [Trifolium repens]|nr:hypothetical protein P8452_13723 [Trifolium repens]
MATWEDINELSEDEDSEEANLALMATGESDCENDSESDTDDIDETAARCCHLREILFFSLVNYRGSSDVLLLEDSWLLLRQCKASISR